MLHFAVKPLETDWNDNVFHLIVWRYSETDLDDKVIHLIELQYL